MKSGWQVCSIFGIPLYIDPSWFLILIAVTFYYSAIWQEQGWGSDVARIAGFITALSLFLSVLLHELGHSLVARSQGINVTSITLFLFGGVASIDKESKTPGQAFQVAIAGPAVSFLLFILLASVGYGVHHWVDPDEIQTWSEPMITVVVNLAQINLVLAVFNMIPGLPLDGGQVLKAAIWKLTGNRLQGVRWAARAGLMLGWGGVTLGFILLFQLGSLQALWFVLLGWFCIRNANTYSNITNLQESLLKLTAAHAMSRDFRVVDAHWSLQQFAEQYLLNEAQPLAYFAAADGRYCGQVDLEDIRQVERSLWTKQNLAEVVQPLTEIPTVQEEDSLAEVIEALENQNLKEITVLSPAGALAGLVDRGDIVKVVAERLNYPISAAIIQRIKEDAAFPPGLPLQAIAKAALEL